MKHSLAAALLAAGVLSLGGLALAVATASAGSALHCNPSSSQCPVGSLITGPSPVPLPGNCPSWLSTDTWSLDFTDGNAVLHESTNKNGDWGGVTAEGPAALTSFDGTVQYAGHATEWGGGGNNSGGQTEGGFTLTFHGSGIAGSLSIHVDGHSTTNNGGIQTNNFTNVAVSCS